MSKISEIIKKLRSAPFSLSQNDIQEQTGISQSRISRWENGNVAAGADDALKLVALMQKLTPELAEKAATNV